MNIYGSVSNDQDFHNPQDFVISYIFYEPKMNMES